MTERKTWIDYRLDEVKGNKKNLAYYLQEFIENKHRQRQHNELWAMVSWEDIDCDDSSWEDGFNFVEKVEVSEDIDAIVTPEGDIVGYEYTSPVCDNCGVLSCDGDGICEKTWSQAVREESYCPLCGGQGCTSRHDRIDTCLKTWIDYGFEKANRKPANLNIRLRTLIEGGK